MKARKILVMVMALALTAALAVGGTLAYLTSTKTVTNTFTVGKVDITLDEAKVDTTGVAVTPAERIQGVSEGDPVGNVYHLMPGHPYTKDPTIHVVANSEDSFVFVKVENGIANYEATTEDGVYTSIAGQIIANGWTQLTDAEGKDVENVYYKEYTKNTSVVDLPVFANFKIKDNAETVTGWSNITEENTKVIVTGYAVQKDGFTSAYAAWDTNFDKA